MMSAHEIVMIGKRLADELPKMETVAEREIAAVNQTLETYLGGVKEFMVTDIQQNQRVGDCGEKIDDFETELRTEVTQIMGGGRRNGN